MPDTEFRLRCARWMRPILTVSAMAPERVRIVLSDTELVVRAGPWFRTTIPRSSMRSAARRRDAWWAIGVHTDFRGSWLINGSPRGIVMVELDPPARARMAGIPVKVKRLGLSLDDPDAFLSACGLPSTPGA